MQATEAKQLIFEWLYGVQLYLENDNGKIVLSKFLGSVERETFVLLLEWVIPLAEDLDSNVKEELSFWKNRHHGNAWNVFLAGRFARDDFWDQKLWEKQFNDMREQARACRSQIIDLMQLQSHVNEEGDRLTPVIAVFAQDLDNCKPSERTTIRCDDDPETKARVERYLQGIVSQNSESEFGYQPSLQSKKAIPPPTLHPTDTQMPAVQIPENKAPSFLPSSGNEEGTQINIDNDLVLTVKQDKD
jgi:hypothetical protein